MGSELLQIVIPVLVPLTAASVSLVAYRAARARLKAVQAACEALGLARVKDAASAYRAEGTIADVRVTATMTPLTLSAALPWAVAEPVTVEATARRLARVRDETATGDADFDAVVQLGGSEGAVAVLAAAESRAWIRRVLGTKRQFIREGRIWRHVLRPPGAVAEVRRLIEEVAGLAAAAPRLHPDNTTRAAMLERASDASDGQVAAHFIRRLLAIHGKTPEGEAASRLALGNADPELRLLAASRLAGDGIDTLLGLAGDASLAPSLRARAVAAASASSCWPLALHTLRGLLAPVGPPEVIAAAAEGLGLVGETAALGALRELLAHESAAVRQAALRAIERMDHGSLDGLGGALAVAESSDALDGALVVQASGGEVALTPQAVDEVSSPSGANGGSS